jgi:deoxycytidylate deaminase
MRILDPIDSDPWIERAASVARHATCGRSKCGSIIVSDGEVIGEGFNSPPGNLESERRCDRKKTEYHPKVTDKTCCVHAEERAIMDALRRNPDRVVGSTLYFIRLDTEGRPSHSGEPYCTICSKMALDVGISSFVLWRKEGAVSYPTDEYNRLSFGYQEE